LRFWSKYNFNQMKAKDVVVIFQSNYADEVYDRKARAVTMFLEDRPEGFSYNELKEITQITVIGCHSELCPL
jgi:hypothetical protein